MAPREWQVLKKGIVVFIVGCVCVCVQVYMCAHVCVPEKQCSAELENCIPKCVHGFRSLCPSRGLSTLFSILLNCIFSQMIKLTPTFPPILLLVWNDNIQVRPRRDVTGLQRSFLGGAPGQALGSVTIIRTRDFSLDAS